MLWSLKLAQPIALKDGRTIATLGQAREMMLSVPPNHRQGAVWRYVAELLTEAAADRASVAEVEEMLLRGLKGAGLL
jgi:hypothetical protein